MQVPGMRYAKHHDRTNTLHILPTADMGSAYTTAYCGLSPRYAWATIFTGLPSVGWNICPKCSRRASPNFRLSPP